MLHSLLDFWAYSWMFIGAIVAIWMAVAASLNSYPLTTDALKFCAILFILPAWAIRHGCIPKFYRSMYRLWCIGIDLVSPPQVFLMSLTSFIMTSVVEFLRSSDVVQNFILSYVSEFCLKKKLNTLFHHIIGNFPICLITYQQNEFTA